MGKLFDSYSKSNFADTVRSGELYPNPELWADNGNFKKVLRRLDASYWPEILGRDCVVALYLDKNAQRARVAAWSRIGFKTRLFQLWQRISATIFFWRDSELEIRQDGKLSVTTVLDGKRRKARFSYVLVGDLGIVTVGSGEGLWRAINERLGREGAELLLSEAVFKEANAGVGEPGGAVYIDIPPICGYLDRALRPSTVKTKLGRSLLKSLHSLLPEMSERWKRLEGGFLLGGRSEAEFVIEENKKATGNQIDVSVRNPSDDPLAGLMGNGGILYAGTRCDLRGVLLRLLRDEGMSVEFIRPEETSRLEADHFSLSWLGDDLSLVLYQGETGVLNAAIAVSVRDLPLARERVERFLGLADGSRFILSDGKGKKLVRTKKALSVEKKSLDGKDCYTIHSDDFISRLYEPALSFKGERLIVATSEGLLRRISSKIEKPSGVWVRPAESHFFIKGRDTQLAAASTRQMLMLISPFIKKSAERLQLDTAIRLLGISDWLAPLRAAWATTDVRDGKVYLRIGADIDDIPN